MKWRVLWRWLKFKCKNKCTFLKNTNSVFFPVPRQISIPDDHHMSNTQLTTSGSFAELLLPEFWFSSPVINMSNLCFKKSLQMIPMPSPVCDPLASLSQRKVSTTEAVLGLPSLHRWTVLCWLWPKDPVSRKAALIPIFLSFTYTDPRVSFLTPGLLWILGQVFMAILNKTHCLCSRRLFKIKFIGVTLINKII